MFSSLSAGKSFSLLKSSVLTVTFVSLTDHPSSDLVSYHRGDQLARTEKDSGEISHGDFGKPERTGI